VHNTTASHAKAGTMLRFPNAKINIGLFITEKRPDGYHNLETVFYPVPLKDALELLPAEQESMHLSGLKVNGAKENNLVWKALKMLEKDFPKVISPLEIHLHKAIPMGAGLGGGSADGAFMLAMLNDFFHLQLSADRLERYALQLGSDCPFFIRNRPVFATGRGEVMRDVDLGLSGYTLQLICPELHISTAKAFSGITPGRVPMNLAQIADIPVESWKNRVLNDFEQSLFPHYPVLQDIKEQLYRQGAVYASLSGTGSTVYGLFPKSQQAVINIGLPFRSFIC